MLPSSLFHLAQSSSACTSPAPTLNFTGATVASSLTPMSRAGWATTLGAPLATGRSSTQIFATPSDRCRQCRGDPVTKYFTYLLSKGGLPRWDAGAAEPSASPFIH